MHAVVIGGGIIGCTIAWRLAQRDVHVSLVEKYEPGTKKELEAWLAARVAEGRKAFPPKVRLITYTLRYNQADWVTIDALEKHWEHAEVNAELVDEGTIRVTTKNISALTLRFDKDPVPLDKTHPPRVLIDAMDAGGDEAKRAFEAMMPMKKIDVATIEAARRG